MCNADIKTTQLNYNDMKTNIVGTPKGIGTEALHIANVSSCYAVFDDEENIVQLYQTEDKANKGLWEFQNSHPHTEFYVDTIQIN